MKLPATKNLSRARSGFGFDARERFEKKVGVARDAEDGRDDDSGHVESGRNVE